MSLVRRSLGATSLFALVTAGPALAAPKPGPTSNPSSPATTLAAASSFTLQACGGGLFITCLKAIVSIDVNAMLTMQVWNLAGQNGTYPGTVFTQIGLFGLPAGVTISPLNHYSGTGGNKVYHPTDGTTTWSQWSIETQGNGLSGTGITNVKMFVDAASGVVGGLGAGQNATFQFQVAGLPNGFTLEQNFAVHGQGGPNGCSTKVIFTSGAVNTGPYDPACAWTYTVTPEPASVALVATGLGVLGMIGFRRRAANRVK